MKEIKPKGMKETKKTRLSKYNRTDALMTYLPDWQHVQGLNRSKPDRIPAKRGGSRHEKLSLPATETKMELTHPLVWHNPMR